MLEQLEPLGRVTSKRMFGGVGLYAGDRFFALIAGDVLYLKCDAARRAALEGAGGRPFRAGRARRQGTTQYYSVPVSILENSEALVALAAARLRPSRSTRHGSRSAHRRSP